MRPPIGIITTSGEDRTQPYVDTLEAHGARVIHLEIGVDFEAGKPAGILLTGGGDLNESAYDHVISEGERATLGKIEPEREVYERQILQWAFARDLPVLGICRGFQVMNVFAGGTLIPDLPTWQEVGRITPRLVHRQKGDPHLATHDISLQRGSRLAKILGGVASIGVNTSHHQALSAIGAGLSVSARAEDGIIEGLEDPGRAFWVGVQFHPERLWRNYPMFSELFKAFVSAAKVGKGCSVPSDFRR